MSEGSQANSLSHVFDAVQDVLREARRNASAAHQSDRHPALARVSFAMGVSVQKRQGLISSLGVKVSKGAEGPAPTTRYERR